MATTTTRVTTVSAPMAGAAVANAFQPGTAPIGATLAASYPACADEFAVLYPDAWQKLSTLPPGALGVDGIGADCGQLLAALRERQTAIARGAAAIAHGTVGSAFSPAMASAVLSAPPPWQSPTQQWSQQGAFASLQRQQQLQQEEQQEQERQQSSSWPELLEGDNLAARQLCQGDWGGASFAQIDQIYRRAEALGVPDARNLDLSHICAAVAERLMILEQQAVLAQQAAVTANAAAVTATQLANAGLVAGTPAAVLPFSPANAPAFGGYASAPPAAPMPASARLGTNVPLYGAHAFGAPTTATSNAFARRASAVAANALSGGVGLGGGAPLALSARALSPYQGPYSNAGAFGAGGALQPTFATNATNPSTPAALAAAVEDARLGGAAASTAADALQTEALAYDEEAERLFAESQRASQRATAARSLSQRVQSTLAAPARMGQTLTVRSNQPLFGAGQNALGSAPRALTLLPGPGGVQPAPLNLTQRRASVVPTVSPFSLNAPARTSASTPFTLTPVATLAPTF